MKSFKKILYANCGSEGSSTDGDSAEVSGLEDNAFSGFEDKNIRT